jgi:hypothetical protein
MAINYDLTSSEQSVYTHMIKFIQHFPLSMEFFYWLAGKDLENKIIFERFHEGIYERICEYYIDNVCVFEGRANFHLDKIPTSLIEILLANKDSSMLPYLI